MAQRLARLYRILHAAQQAYESGDNDACLILLYSLLDVLGNASRLPGDTLGNGADFRRWVSAYVLPHLADDVTAEDLWSARCGIVHALSQESRWTATERARLVIYADGDTVADNGERWTAVLKQAIASVPGISRVPVERLTILHLGSFLDALQIGFAKYSMEVVGDPLRDQLLTENLDLTLTTISIKRQLTSP